MYCSNQEKEDDSVREEQREAKSKRTRDGKPDNSETNQSDEQQDEGEKRRAPEGDGGENTRRGQPGSERSEDERERSDDEAMTRVRPEKRRGVESTENGKGRTTEEKIPADTCTSTNEKEGKLSTKNEKCEVERSGATARGTRNAKPRRARQMGEATARRMRSAKLREATQTSGATKERIQPGQRMTSPGERAAEEWKEMRKRKNKMN